MPKPIMELYDDRVNWDDQNRWLKTPHVLIIGTDRVLSGWGKARGGVSYAAWACIPEHASIFEQWVRSRGDMLRVRVCSARWRPRGHGHAHIYTVEPGHPALSATRFGGDNE